jgi:hypothetical protein
MERKYKNGQVIINKGPHYPEIKKVVIGRGVRGKSGKPPRYDIYVYYNNKSIITTYTAYENHIDRIVEDFKGEEIC